VTRIELCVEIRAPIQRVFDLSRCIEVHLLGTEESGEKAVGGVTSGLMGEGEFVRWRAKHLGIRQHLASRITGFDAPTYFQDSMIEGAFAFMQHDHFFKVISESETEMKDVFVFAAPIPLLGRLAEALVLKRYMTNLLNERNRVLKDAAESPNWRDFLPASYAE